MNAQSPIVPAEGLFLAANAVDVLQAVRDGAHATPGEVGKACDRPTKNMARLMDGLQRESLVGRADAAGGVEIYVLTEVGHAALAAVDLAQGRRAAPAADAPPLGVVEISLDLIDRDPDLNPRTNFEAVDLHDLAASIRDKGVVQPILLRFAADRASGRYRIVAGERRYRASGIAERTSIPAVVRDLTDDEALEIALIENIQRADLSPIEEARGFRRIIERAQAKDPRLSQRAAAASIVEATRKSLRYVEQRLQLLTLPKADQDRMALPADHPRHLKLTDARGAMQNHDRLNAEAMDVKLTPDLLLLLGELAVFVGKGKAKNATASVGGGAKDEEARLKGLGRPGLIYFHQDWTSGMQVVQVTEKGARVAKLRIAKLENSPQEALRDFALQTLKPPAFAAWQESGKPYVTPWLNDPIELHPAVKAQREATAQRNAEIDAARQQREADARKAKEESSAVGRAFLADVRQLEADLQAGGEVDVAVRLNAILTAHGRPGPWTVTLHQGLPAMCDANGDAFYVAGAFLEAFRRVSTLAVNLALGAPPFTGGSLGEAWEKSIAPDEDEAAEDDDQLDLEDAIAADEAAGDDQGEGD